VIQLPEQQQQSQQQQPQPPPPPPPPPPPLPPNLLKKGGGGPGPPAPPPPPPNLLAKFGKNAPGGGPPPPPTQLLHNVVEIPEYLRKKKEKIAEIPMRKIPWNAAIVSFFCFFFMFLKSPQVLSVFFILSAVCYFGVLALRGAQHLVHKINSFTCGGRIWGLSETRIKFADFSCGLLEN